MSIIADLYAALRLDDSGFEADVVRSTTKAADAASLTMGKRVSSGLKNALGVGLGVAAGATALALGVATRGALQLEEAVASFQSATGASADEAAAAGKVINRVAGEERASLQSVTDVAIKVRNDMGLIGPEADKMTAAIVRFARVTKQDATTAATDFDNILDAWHLSAGDATVLMDKLFVSMQKFGGSVVQRQSDLKTLAPAFQALGLSIDDAIGLLNLFETAGIDASAAQRGLNAAVTKLPKGVTFPEFIAQLSQVADDGDRARLAITVFGSQAGPKLAQAIQPGISGLKDFGVTGAEAMGSVNKGAEVLDNTISGRIQKTLSEASANLREFGASFGPALTGVASLAIIGSQLGGGRLVSAILKPFAGLGAKLAVRLASAIGISFGSSVVSGAASAGGEAIGELTAKQIAARLSGSGAKVIGDSLGTALIGAGEAPVVSQASNKIGQALGSKMGKALSVGFAAVAVIELVKTFNDVQNAIKQQTADLATKTGDFAQKSTTEALINARNGVAQQLANLPSDPIAEALGLSARKGIEDTLGALDREIVGRMQDADKAASLAGREVGQGAVTGIAGGITDAKPTLDAASAGILGLALKGLKGLSDQMATLAHDAVTAYVQGINEKQGAVQQAFAALQSQAATEMSKAKEQAYLIGVLTSKELASGLTDGRPGVRAQAEETRREALARLAELTPESGKLGKAAMAELAKAVHSKDPVVRRAAKAIQKSIKDNLVPASGPIADKAHNLGARAARALVAGFGTPTLRANIVLSNSGYLGGARAAGGPVSAGVPYLVGETRPELFVPDVNGRIIPRVPASLSTSAGSGDTTNITVSLPTSARPDPFQVADQLRRFADFGVLSPRGAR